MNTLMLAACLALSTELDRALLAPVVDPYLVEHGVPGAVIALVLPDGSDPVEAFGLADVESATPMEKETRFQVDSVTKPLTASLVVLLAGDEKLGLERTLAEVLPGGTKLGEGIGELQVQQLLAHTSGLPREASNRENLPNTPSVMRPMSQETLLAGLAKTRLEFTPGERWSYSNLGYALLGVAASQTGEQPYEVLLRERVLRPLGMTSSDVYTDRQVPTGLASCYWPEDSELILRDPWKFGTSASFSGLVSTAPDLARFLRAQMQTGEGSLFNEQQLEVLHSPVVTIDASRGRSMSSGWFVDPLPFGGQVAIGHGGELDGHSSIVAFFPGLKAGLVVLCNKGGKSAENLAFAVMGVLLPRLMQPR